MYRIMKNNNHVILVNGPGSSGKSSASLELANALHFSFLSTGNVYRSFAWALQKAGIKSYIKELCLPIMKKYNFDYVGKSVYLHGTDIANDIGYEELAYKTAHLAKKQWYRDYINDNVILPYIKNKNIVIEGRGLTEICPEPDINFFLKSSIYARAQRRLRQYIERYGVQNVSLETIYKQIKRRDDLDINRKIAPLKAIAGTKVVNNTKLKRIDTVKRMLIVVHARFPDWEIDWQSLNTKKKKK